MHKVSDKLDILLQNIIFYNCFAGNFLGVWWGLGVGWGVVGAGGGVCVWQAAILWRCYLSPYHSYFTCYNLGNMLLMEWISNHIHFKL